MWDKLIVWVGALRSRTLLLAYCSITMGALLALPLGAFSTKIYLLALLTAILLQILSNMANEYGDAVHGADHAGRVGPVRAIQSGRITKKAMKKALILTVFLCLVSGILLLWVALAPRIWDMLFFFTLGILSIWAAIAYTMGSNPYGYAGFGDLAVFLFFGPVSVLGSLYLFSQHLSWSHILPATTCGAFSAAVLNINNIRDIESDSQAGKHSIPVWVGRQKALWYHVALLFTALLSMLVYTIVTYRSVIQLLFLLLAPLLVVHSIILFRKPLYALDVMLKYMILIFVGFVFFFAIGMLY